jgi:hypothetical protein
VRARSPCPGNGAATRFEARHDRNTTDWCRPKRIRTARRTDQRGQAHRRFLRTNGSEPLEALARALEPPGDRWSAAECRIARGRKPLRRNAPLVTLRLRMPAWRFATVDGGRFGLVDVICPRTSVCGSGATDARPFPSPRRFVWQRRTSVRASPATHHPACRRWRAWFGDSNVDRWRRRRPA